MFFLTVFLNKFSSYISQFKIIRENSIFNTVIYWRPQTQWNLLIACVSKYVDGISQNLRILNPYQPGLPTVFSFLQIMVKQVKSSNKTSRYQQVNRH